MLMRMIGHDHEKEMSHRYTIRLAAMNQSSPNKMHELEAASIHRPRKKTLVQDYGGNAMFRSLGAYK
jgi:hypothetical protein